MKKPPRPTQRYGLMPIKKRHPRVGRNDVCPCKSGKKFKNCHGAEGLFGGAAVRKKTAPRLVTTVRKPLPPGVSQTDMAMIRAGIDPAFVYAMHHVGKMINDVNRAFCTPEECAAWDSAVADYRRRRAEAEQVAAVTKDVVLDGPKDDDKGVSDAIAISPEGPESRTVPDVHAE